MQINRITPNMNFKGVHMVQVPKRIFDHPDDSIECSQIFNEIGNLALEQEFEDTFINRLKLKLGTKDSVKFLTFLESPGYEKTQYVLNGSGRSLMWLAKNSNSDLTLPRNEDKHTFYILTGEEKEEAQREYSPLNYFKIRKEALKKYEKTEDAQLNALRRGAKISELMDKIFTKIIKRKVVNVWDAKDEVDLANILRAIAQMKD